MMQGSTTIPCLVANKSEVEQIMEQLFIFRILQMWPWPWRQEPNLFAKHSGSWWYTNTPSFITFTKGSAVQKISSGQIFPADLNLHYDFDLEDSNQKIVTQHSQLAVQKISGQIFPADFNPHYDFDLEDSNPQIVNVTQHSQLVIMHHRFTTKFGSKRWNKIQ